MILKSYLIVIFVKYFQFPCFTMFFFFLLSLLNLLEELSSWTGSDTLYKILYLVFIFQHVSMACVHLASKIEEAPRRIRDVINVFHRLRHLREKK